MKIIVSWDEQPGAVKYIVKGRTVKAIMEDGTEINMSTRVEYQEELQEEDDGPR